MTPSFSPARSVRAGGDSATLSRLYIAMALVSTSLPWALDGDKLTFTDPETKDHFVTWNWLIEPLTRIG